LNIKGTKAVVGKFIKAPEIHHAEPLAVKAGKKESTEGLGRLSENSGLDKLLI